MGVFNGHGFLVLMLALIGSFCAPAPPPGKKPIVLGVAASLASHYGMILKQAVILAVEETSDMRHQTSRLMSEPPYIWNLPVTEEELKELSWMEFQNWVCEGLNAKVAERYHRDMGIEVIPSLKITRSQ